MFQISNFQASLDKSGVMRTNRFMAFFNLPAYLQDNKELYGYGDALVSLRCHAAQIPGITLNTIDQPRIGIGPVENVASNLTIDDVTLTFLVDGQSKIHNLFYDWFNTIVNFQGSKGQSALYKSYNIGRSTSAAYEVGYKDSYTTDILISVYDGVTPSGTSVDGQPTPTIASGNVPIMNIRAFKAFPKTLPSIDMDWNSNDEVVKMSVPFSITDFEVTYPANKTQRIQPSQDFL